MWPFSRHAKIEKPDENSNILVLSKTVQKTKNAGWPGQQRALQKTCMKPDDSGGQDATLAAFGDGQTPENVGVLSVSLQKGAR